MYGWRSRLPSDKSDPSSVGRPAGRKFSARSIVEGRLRGRVQIDRLDARRRALVFETYDLRTIRRPVGIRAVGGYRLDVTAIGIHRVQIVRCVVKTDAGAVGRKYG